MVISKSVAIAVRAISTSVSIALLSQITSVWIWAIFSYTGAHLSLDVRVLARKRNSREVDTPVILNDIPDIPLDEQPQQSPVEVHELVSRAY
ncbi:hypothetical protein WOLCODRAFT_155883 [Wolfiporia cocos MD-104 SS10]|uniref:Uncharacterized protein n=1 Tax=Wolfiporia cocos (strain MD-104) TaxID=742152 RepID=A0A2H3IYY9_WOLCO|nr:hypothetical protein WOLCODRAFT_155883 [Wolfiporia cocos MD-104 SS10]